MADIVTVKPSADAKPAETPTGPPGEATNATLGPQVLEAYKQMLVSLFLATLVISLVTIAITLSFYMAHKETLVEVPSPLVPDAKVFSAGRTDPPLMIILIFAGALGAFFSSLMRLYDFADLPKALIEPGLGRLPSGYLLIYSLVPSVVGAIAATVLYITFAAGLLEGALFPKFACKFVDQAGKALAPEACHTFGTTISDFGPQSAADYAKALIWAFIAGFAERLVPDALQSFASKVETAEQAPPHGG
jgi:hypothetical protein